MSENKKEKLKSVWLFYRTQAFGSGVKNLSIPRETPAGFFFFSLVWILTAGILFSSQPALQAEEGSVIMVSSEVTDRPFGERKILRGHIGGISKEGVALELNASQEMWFPYTVGMRLSGYSNAQDIQTGDEVVLTYEEDAEKTRRVLREINFVQRKAPAPEVPESDEPEADL